MIFCYHVYRRKNKRISPKELIEGNAVCIFKEVYTVILIYYYQASRTFNFLPRSDTAFISLFISC